MIFLIAMKEEVGKHKFNRMFQLLFTVLGKIIYQIDTLGTIFKHRKNVYVEYII